MNAFLLGSLTTLLLVSPEFSATQQQGVHPALLRRDHNPLLRVEITAARRAFLESATFSLEGTDSLADLERLELFSTGSRGSFQPTARLGKSVSPSIQIQLRGHLRLEPGRNFIWLSGRLREGANLDHRIRVRCTSLETSDGTFRPAVPPQGRGQRIGVALRRHFDDGIHTSRIPVLGSTPRGTLLCVFDARRRSSRDLQEDIDIGLLRSTSGGATWEPLQIILDRGEYGGLPEEQNGVSDPGLVVDPSTGEVFVFAVWTHGRPETHQWREGGSDPGFEIGQTGQFLMVRSRDDGRTWSAPVNLTRKLKREEWILLAPSPQQGIALPDGTLVMPVAGRDENDTRFSTVMLSRDHGETWTVRTPYRGGTTECQAALLPDGQLMLNCRSARGVLRRTVVVSSDLGETWLPHPTNLRTLVEPTCNGSLYRLDVEHGGKLRQLLLFANPLSTTRRENLTIQVSLDGGQAWPNRYHRLLDEGRGRGYASLSRAGDRHVGIVYEGSQADIVFERLSIEELLGETSG